MSFHGPTISETTEREKLLKSPRNETGGNTDEVGYAVYQVALRKDRARDAMLDLYANSAEMRIKNMSRVRDEIQRILLEQSKTANEIVLEGKMLSILEAIGLSLCDDLSHMNDENPVDYLLQKIEWFFGLLETHGFSDVFGKNFAEPWKTLQEFKTQPHSLN